MKRNLRSIVVALMALPFTAQMAPAQDKVPTKITIATEGDFRPWNFIEAGELKGIEIDLARDLCARMKIECSFVTQPFDGIITSLTAGKYDVVMDSINATKKRREIVAFSIPYANDGNALVAIKGSGLEDMPYAGEVVDLDNEQDAQKKFAEIAKYLEGKTLATQAASINIPVIEKYLTGVVDLKLYKSPDEHNLDLTAGRVDIVMGALPVMRDFAMTAADEGAMLVVPRFVNGDLGSGASVVFRKEDTKLREMFDEALRASFADGTYKRISEKWTGFDATPKQ